MIGWIGNVFIVLGLYGIGFKWRIAFVVSVIGELFWIYVAAHRGQWDLAVMCVIFAVLAVRNFVLWGQPAEVEPKVEVTPAQLLRVASILLGIVDFIHDFAGMLIEKANRLVAQAEAEELV